MGGREAYCEVRTLQEAGHPSEHLVVERGRAAQPRTGQQPTDFQDTAQRIAPHVGKIAYVQRVAHCVTPKPVGNDRDAIRAMFQGESPCEERPRQQHVIVIQRGEPGRVDLRSTESQRARDAGFASEHHANARVALECLYESHIPLIAVYDDEWYCADTLLGQDTLERSREQPGALLPRERRYDHRDCVARIHHIVPGDTVSFRGSILQLDARQPGFGKTLECDVCIIGSGPAGISVALELAECGARVIVLESGGSENEPQIQELNDGTTVGDSYAGLRATRHRALGGTVNLWNTGVDGGAGAKYVPLDPWDVEPRAGASLPGWPIDYATLERYYVRAQTLCGLGPFSYEAAEWESPGRSAWPLPGSSVLTSRIYQFGHGRLFTADYVNALSNRGNVRLCDHATVVCLTRGSHDRITQAQARVTTTGEPLQVMATFFVLAAGAIENARLLLLSAEHAGAAFASGHDWIGRCFMEHPRDTALSLVPRSQDLVRAAGFYDAHAARADLTVCGRLALRSQAAAAHRLPNLSITLLPAAPLAGPVGRSLRRIGLIRERRGYGWSHDPDPARFIDRFQLLINLEQRPRPENRVVLSRERDALGVPRAELHWNWSAAEQAEWERTRSLIAADIESAGLGKVERRTQLRPDPNAHHHAGTTRMANHPQWGVVDRDGRVYGTDNLYVTGASVFPTAGFANPTLTIVALAIRLAEHLRDRI